SRGSLRPPSRGALSHLPAPQPRLARPSPPAPAGAATAHRPDRSRIDWPMRFGRSRSGEEPREDSGLYAKLILLLALVAYLIAFVLENRRQVSVHFVFASSRVSLIWLILFSIAIGALGGAVISQLHRRRRRLP